MQPREFHPRVLGIHPDVDVVHIGNVAGDDLDLAGRFRAGDSCKADLVDMVAPLGQGTIRQADRDSGDQRVHDRIGRPVVEAVLDMRAQERAAVGDDLRAAGRAFRW